MIVKVGHKNKPVCDGCGAELEPQYDYWDCAAMMKRAGWKTVRESVEWYNFCPACKERRKYG
jgi:Fe2+ or Zn2+ uptake regulation protein